jgi:DNA repair exonuclease SbcCD ATPase subunit
MIALNVSPPPLPTNEALASAMTILAVAANPEATSARLTELVEQMQAIRDAIAEHETARKSAEAAQAKLGGLEAAQAKLAAEQAVLNEARLQNDNAASALRDRETKIAAAEVAQAKERDEIAAREKALAAKLASYRQALA